MNDNENDPQVQTLTSGQFFEFVFFVGEIVPTAAFQCSGIQVCMNYHGHESIFNIGSGRGYSVNEIIMQLGKLLGDSLQVRRYPGRKVDVPVNVLDIGRAKHELAWQPQVSLQEGLRKMLRFWNEEGRTFDGT